MAIRLKAVARFDTATCTPAQLLKASRLMDEQHIGPTERFVRFIENGKEVEMPLDEAIEWLSNSRGD